MAKVSGALFSLTASGTLKKTLTYSRAKGRTYCKGNRLEKIAQYHFRCKPVISQTEDQLAVRDTYRKIIKEWNELTPEQKEPYYEQAKKVFNTPVGIFVQTKMYSEYNKAAYNEAWLQGIGFGILNKSFDNEYTVLKLLSIHME